MTAGEWCEYSVTFCDGVVVERPRVVVWFSVGDGEACGVIVVSWGGCLGWW